MSRGEIRLTGSKNQTEALKHLISRLYPEYESVQEWIKETIGNRLNCNWNEIQKKSEELK